MKIKIKRNGSQWVVHVIQGVSKTTAFANSEAAFVFAEKQLKRARKEASAFSMLNKLAWNLLSVQERDFIVKLTLNNCVGITKPQYGYLKGIHERQEREW